MPKEEWGKKRICPTTGKRFYDLNRSPVVSPYTGQVVSLDVGRSRTMVADLDVVDGTLARVSISGDFFLSYHRISNADT